MNAPLLALALPGPPGRFDYITDELLLRMVIPNATLLGIIAACFVRRLPPSGKAALASLIVPVLSIFVLCIFFDEDIRFVFSGAIFAFSLPCCFAFSLHSRRQRSERKSALAALAGSAFLSVIYFPFVIGTTSEAVRELWNL